MKFASKAHMAQELMTGKRFRSDSSTVIYYDERFPNPFRHGANEMHDMWNAYNKDIWTEIEPRHVHQALIDSYQEGQAWQYTELHMAGLYQDCKCRDTWVEPCWDESIIYRLHPYNELIQAFNNGAKIQYKNNGKWIDTTCPSWFEYTQYRIKPERTKPVTKIVYEWMFKSKFEDKWMIEEVMLDEKEAKEHFNGHEYRKTGREFEVEV